MAGVLPYTRINNEVYVLIGEERGGGDKGTWDMFSGRSDKTDTSLKMTAAREAAEESCELIGKMKDIQERMFPLNKSKSSFLMKIEDPENINNDAFTARKKMHQYKSSCYQEKREIKSVKLADFSLMLLSIIMEF